MSVRENLVLGGYVQHAKGNKQFRDYLEHVFELFPVLRERQEQLAGTLSGGEQQMLAMGRALMARPALIMLDEPSTGLAPLVVKAIFGVIRRMREEGDTVLLIEQNAKAALAVADRGYVIETGKITVQGPAADLLANRDVQRAYLGRDVE
jgi:branched-chain amino acid transport system ATP-binding protein